MHRLSAIVSLAALMVFCGCPPGNGGPVTVFAAQPMRPYLTWQSDPCTTITINYQTATQLPRVAVHYGLATVFAATGTFTNTAQGTSHQVEGLPDGRYIHSVRLTDLEPGTRYRFSIAGAKDNNGNVYAFKTIADDDSPRRFVCGGDMGTRELTVALMGLAAALNPEFAVIGGDLAYANGDFANVDRWDAWLNHWFDTMVTPAGDLIPMVLAIGNHETNNRLGPPRTRAPFYFGFFPQGDTSYFVRDFGPNLSLIMLDSGHIARFGGAQTAWLEETLATRAEVSCTIAVYHVPLYPSHRSYTGPNSMAGRLNWLPLFDRHGLDLAFENHDHALKRTFPLKGGMVDPTGTLYLGDGCFGKDARTVSDRWYLEYQARTPHFWLVEAGPEHIRASAINREGEVVDQIERSPYATAP